MRPAKYSLNGYIPRPSLGQQQPAGRSKLKDLDSSTSNEIFSRRRGIQQRAGSASGELAGSLNDHRSQAERRASSAGKASGKASAPSSQMEQNKRKYILQQQLDSPRSPALSVHKANLIKAKLGLLVSTGANSTAARGSALDGAQPQASTSSVLTAEPADAPASPAPIGAPLNSIPKTDFECTDKRGKFVAGLFADHKTGCQVWHLCANNRKYSFLCPTGTIFNAKLRICDWRYNVKCEPAKLF